MIPVANEFFGGNTAVTGLMVGHDLQRVLANEPTGHRYLLARRLPVRRTVPRRNDRRRSAATGRGHRDGRHLTSPSPGAHIMTLPVVVIVGRPNVGKSTLFNRIVGEQVAIVEDRPGVTRDRNEVEAEWLGVHFLLVDTGGWLPGGNDLDAKVSRQVEAAVQSADVVLFLVDSTTGVTEDDESLAQWLRRIKAPVLLVTNKADNERRENDRWEFLALGAGDPYPVSALHGRRAGDLLDEVISLPAAFRGRATEVPGIDLEDATELWKAGDHRRHASRSSDDPTSARARCSTVSSASRSFGRARHGGHDSRLHRHPGRDARRPDRVRRHRRHAPPQQDRRFGRVLLGRPCAARRSTAADIALLVIDATDGITSQDQRLAERVDAAGCPIVVMLNKWELIDDPEQRLQVQAELKRKLYFVGDAPVLKISALTGKGVHKLRPVLQEAITQYHRRVPTRDVNRVDLGRAATPTGRSRRARAVCVARRDRSADVHAVRQPRAAAHLPSLSRAQHPRGIRVRQHTAEAASEEADRLVPWCEDCAKYWAPAAMNEDGTCPTCGRTVEAPERQPVTAKNLDLRKLAARGGRRGSGEGSVALQAPDGAARALPHLANRPAVHVISRPAPRHPAFGVCGPHAGPQTSNASVGWRKAAGAAMVLASVVAGCGHDAKPGFDEAAVAAYLRGLNLTDTTNELDPALLEDARNICTRPLDDGTIALIKVSVGQGTGAILRAGCPDRVDDVLAKG